MRGLAPALLVGAAVGALTYVAIAARAARAGEAAARRSAEAALLAAEDLVVVGDRDREHLEDELSRLSASNADLAAEVERARSTAPGSRVVAVASASTGPVAVETPKSLTPGVNETKPPCLLAAGDRVELRVDEAVLETRAGNRVLVGASSMWRVEPAPIERLAHGPFAASLTLAEAVAPEPDDGWPAWAVAVVGVGAAVAAGKIGYEVGQAVSGR